MKSFAIMTDSAANLDGKRIAQWEITVLPLPYFKDGQEQECPDVLAFDDTAYYAELAAGAKMSTSQINPQRYCEKMEPLLRNGQDILFIGLSSGVSGSFASAQMAAQILQEEYPERSICLVDSLGASLGEGLLVLWAAQYRQEGYSLEETVHLVEEHRLRMYQVFVVNDLLHLRRTGRLSNFNAVVGTLLGIKPLLKGSSEGKIVAFGKTRGFGAAIDALAEKYRTLARHMERVAISYTGCKESAEKLASKIQAIHPPKELIVLPHEPATGIHIGPNALALYFEGDETARLQ